MRQRIPGRSRQFAMALRANQTDAEWRLWSRLRAGRLGGLKFKRQVPMDGYIVDFVCLEARLIIEVDGGQHAGSTGDSLRDAHFHAAGFRTMRFWNRDVLEDVDQVVHQVAIASRQRFLDP